MPRGSWKGEWRRTGGTRAAGVDRAAASGTQPKKRKLFARIVCWEIHGGEVRCFGHSKPLDLVLKLAVGFHFFSFPTRLTGPHIFFGEGLVCEGCLILVFGGSCSWVLRFGSV